MADFSGSQSVRALSFVVCRCSVTDLSEELLNELLSPAEMKAPRLGRVTDVGRVNDQSQRLRFINAAKTCSKPLSLSTPCRRSRRHHARLTTMSHVQHCRATMTRNSCSATRVTSVLRFWAPHTWAPLSGLLTLRPLIFQDNWTVAESVFDVECWTYVVMSVWRHHSQSSTRDTDAVGLDIIVLSTAVPPQHAVTLRPWFHVKIK